MSNFPGSPQVTKGAIIGIDMFNPVSSVTIFQYNPENMTRTLTPKTAGGDLTQSLRFIGAPEETIKIEVAIDAIDQMEQGEGSNGIFPQLSALEMLVYPKTAQVILNTALLATGKMEIVPPLAPMTLFVWGWKRVLPVQITGFSITEEYHDANLNPIRAKVSLDLRVLSYNDLSIKNAGRYIFMAHQVIKEVMATIGSIDNLGSFADMF